MSDITSPRSNCPNCGGAFDSESDACGRCGRKREENAPAQSASDRAEIHAQTLARYRQRRESIRGVKILADCCPSCDLDANREFALDAVPALPHSYCTNPRGCRCCYVAVTHGAETATESAAGLAMAPPVLVGTSVIEEQRVLHSPVTPLAVFVGVCVLVLFLSFGILKNGSQSRTAVAPLRYASSTVQSRPAAPVYATTAAKAKVPAQSREDRARERAIQAKAARDLAEMESIAKANANAVQAHAVAAQQQAYLQSAFGSQMRSLPAAVTLDRSRDIPQAN